MKRDIDQIEGVIRSRLAEEYPRLVVRDVRVSDGTDMDGDRVLLVDVVFAGSEDKVNAAELVSVVRVVRPSLLKAEEDAFPIFSFISEQDDRAAPNPRKAAGSR